MSVEVRIPDRDVPRPIGLAIVGVVALAAGLAIAWWGMEPSAEAELPSAAGPSEGTSTSLGTSAGTGADTSTSAGTSTGASTGTSAGVGTSAGAGTSTGTSTGTGTGAATSTGADAGTDTSASAGAGTGTSASASTSTSTSATTSDEEAGTGRAPPGRLASGELRVRRGRVAYLRCAGVGRGGACPRDESLEASVWPIIEALPACGRAPETEGEADLRIEYAGAEAPEVEWRDTFADAVVRLDRDRVLACLRPALARTRQSLGAERLLVSFRFSLAP